MAQTFDYRDILKTLNSIGYTNISAAELKAFKKDLNALIKYESENSLNVHANVPPTSARQNKENVGIVRAEILQRTKQIRAQSSKPTATQTHEKKTVDRSTQSDEKADKEKPTRVERPLTTTAVPSTIANKQQPGRAKTKFQKKFILVKNTPVDLYQKYKRDWEKFRKFIPGENTREEVRKEVRAKVQKAPPPKPTIYIHYANGHKYTYDE